MLAGAGFLVVMPDLFRGSGRNSEGFERPADASVSTLREGPCSQGASWAVCGSGVPPYALLNLYGI